MYIFITFLNMQKVRWLLGFTLVELIVVITIVWILSTVWFVSYSGYLTGARDSNRISQMTKLADSLQVYAARKNLPLPDDYVQVTATGVLLGYQWYAWVDVLETIDYTNGGKDPKDDSYYTYYVNKNRKLFQFTALLEEQWATSSVSKAYAVDYSDRYPKSYGKKLGVVTDTNNTPIQEISSIVSAGELDIYSTSDTYTIHFNDEETLSGTWGVLRWASAGWWLVGYWSFEALSGTNFHDASANNTVWVAAWGVSVSSDWVIGNSVSFDGVNDTYLVDSIAWVWGNGSSPHTISAWVKPTAIPGDCGWNNTCREWMLSFWNIHEQTSGSHLWLTWWHNGNRFGISHGSQWDVRSLLWWVWTHVVSVYDGEDIVIYLNGKKVPFRTAETYQEAFNIKNPSILLWQQPSSYPSTDALYDGKIDELRLYNRDLEYEEIQNIYDMEKKGLGL